MARIELLDDLISKLGPEMKMDVHWIDVKLKSGKIYKNIVVKSGKYLTGIEDGVSGENTLPFISEEIAAIRRHSVFSWLKKWN